MYSVNSLISLRLTSTFLGKRRFLRVKKSSGKNPAAEALVNSLVMMEGQSTTTMEILEEHDEATSSNDQEVKSPYHNTKLFSNFFTQQNHYKNFTYIY